MTVASLRKTKPLLKKTFSSLGKIKHFLQKRFCLWEKLDFLFKIVPVFMRLFILLKHFLLKTKILLK